MTRRPGGLFAAVLLLGLVALQAVARPGGGNSYSGGSSSRGGSSSSGGGSSGSSGGSGFGSSSSSSSSSSSRGSISYDNSPGSDNAFLFHATTFFAYLFFPLLFVLIGIANSRSMSQRQLQLDSLPPAMSLRRPPEEDVRDGVLAAVREHDPGFSLVLFEDFAYALYAQSQRARHEASGLAELAPYWAQEQLKALANRRPVGARVQAAVVGSLWPENVLKADGELRLRCTFEANLHLQLPPGQVPSALTQYVQESWIFSRDATVKTRPWSGVRKLGCPSCGAPFRSTADARCESCGQATGGGRFDWQVSRVVVRQEEAWPHSLTGTSEEVGTDGPTWFSPRVKERRDELFRDDPGVSQATLEARLRLIYGTLQPAWTAQDLRPVRPYVSDRLYAYLQYWIDAYREQGLHNRIEGPRFQKFAIVRVERDSHFDAITMRVWATGCDFTVEESGLVVGGSRSKPRAYSEYWTLVRSANVRGAPRLDKKCPGCGAPLAINMAGECEHCSAHVTSGEFDWVLSKIEQDEAYRG